jgi:hypothetical protein
VGDFGIAGPHTRLAAISCRYAYTYKLVIIYPDAVIIYFIAMRARGKLSTYTILHSSLSLSLSLQKVTATPSLIPAAFHGVAICGPVFRSS